LAQTTPAATTQASELGRRALSAGRVGVILTAGGQGSRLGFNHPKGMYPIGPISGASLFQIHFEKIVAISRRHGVQVPLYLMTSPATHDETLQYLEANQRFGLPAEDLHVFCQGTMPAVDRTTGKILLEEKGQLFQSPDGHGGAVAALAKSGALSDMQARGIDLLFYFQVDNPLVPVCDPYLIGHHLGVNSELTSLAVEKKHPHEKWGNFDMHVVEYSDMPDDVAELRDADGGLKFWAGSLAIHVFARQLLERAAENLQLLPFHIARKKVPYLDEAGQKVSPSEPNALKFERFIFDLLPAAERPLVVEYAEADCLAPLKNAPGAEVDTAEYVQEMLLALHRRWLQSAGASLADGVQVEIGPLFALDAEQVRARVRPGQEFHQSQYLPGD
jgi:UDP-N-acetylglucosamine/UDP-N-acetylgalactosamine diphosphorylase